MRECPVKAIKLEGHQAKIIEERCILCGRCTEVCPQNAKKVHSELDKIEAMLKSGKKTVVSLAPSFVSSFQLQSFALMRDALKRCGFSEIEETAVGAKAVNAEYEKLLKSGVFKNLISSACPAINRMIQLYYPAALQYLAPVASPMVAHARMLKKKYPDYSIVFIGPCIAKKREAAESGIIDGVLTFEELQEFFDIKHIDLSKLWAENEKKLAAEDEIANSNRAKFYPISRGIIKSFENMPEGYEYVAVDGVRKSFEMLHDIESLSGMFIEVNCCEYSCINGPCAIKNAGGSLKANQEVRRYANSNLARPGVLPLEPPKADFLEGHEKKRLPDYMPTENEIKAILARTGKFKPEDEINCGACGYSTCREKAIAVANGYADIEMCIPYMRTRAETMSYEVIKNSPNGIIVLDTDYKIIQANDSVCALLGIGSENKGQYAFELFDAQEFVQALSENKNVNKKKIYISSTKKYAELSVVLLKEQKIIFGVYKDITNRIEYGAALNEVKNKTLKTTDEVIKKQMRVAQEIASLLGETTAETKVALLNLKRALQSEENGDDDGTLS